VIQHTCYRCEREADDLVLIAATAYMGRPDPDVIELWACPADSRCHKDWREANPADGDA
jgi:hypothetical protein